MFAVLTGSVRSGSASSGVPLEECPGCSGPEHLCAVKLRDCIAGTAGPRCEGGDSVVITVIFNFET